jgi:hypothetical protein
VLSLARAGLAAAAAAAVLLAFGTEDLAAWEWLAAATPDPMPAALTPPTARADRTSG